MELPLNDDQVELDPNKDYLSELVGDGKKFKDNEALAKGKYHSDQTIEMYKREMDELREHARRLKEDNQTKANLQELIDQLKTGQTSSNTEPKVNEEKPYNPDDVKKAVAAELATIRAADKQTANLNLVTNKLKEKYGDNYPQALRQQIKNLGLDNDTVQELAAKHPQVLIKTLGLEDQQVREQYQNPLQSSQRNDTFAPKNVEKRTWTYWQKVKKENPNWFYDTKITNQMTQDAIELGDAFRDGDYYSPGVHER